MKKLAVAFMIICLAFNSCVKDDDVPEEVPVIEYPQTVGLLTNVLSSSLTQIIGGEKYCVAAYLPEGTSVKVVIKPSSGYSSTGIGVYQMENNGWTINSADADNTILQATGSDQTVSISFMTGPPTSVDFFVHENDSIEPTITKTLTNF